ncbi:aspartic proteinase-like protein 2 isoform X2 [Ipomoea triloba]|uniref:aspartic proteinase-like protein 2 isoform X2 n=1 Tax=Ipomoea triloba TaxID=35885 RepID=UPI00125D20D9|nr:aspartic proteinase-like protein 2 isoform X2 [Ipomoea triloba]
MAVMAVPEPLMMLVVMAAAATLITAANGVSGTFPRSVMTLERAFPANQKVELEELRARDRLRHARLLQNFAGGIANFPVIGSSDPYLVGLYFTRIKLGSPPREFNVQIDTGSDILWVTCSSCNNCPRTSGLGVELSFYDAASSSTAAHISCSDRICDSIIRTASASAQCSAESNQCSYSFQYGDASGTSGQYVSDMLYFDTVLGASLIANSSAPIVFGLHYNVYLQSIAVNGQLLPIDPEVFATSGNCGTIVDSGTTLAYLVPEAYEPFVSAITSSVSQLARPVISTGKQCFLVSTSITEIFPSVSLNFAGGASMALRPSEYLVHMGFVEGSSLWCIGFEKMDCVTILGDIILKDKIFVYDLAHQRIGWADYDCSMSVNVSITSGKDEFISSGQLSVSGSSSSVFLHLQPTPCRISTHLLRTLILMIGLGFSFL